MLNILIEQLVRLHTLEGTPGSGKTFLKKSHIIFKMQDKIVLLTMTIRTSNLRLSQYACIVHIQFKLPIHVYLYVLSQSSDPLQNFLKHAHYN
jgi:hypothetical protein